MATATTTTAEIRKAVRLFRKAGERYRAAALAYEAAPDGADEHKLEALDRASRKLRATGERASEALRAGGLAFAVVDGVLVVDQDRSVGADVPDFGSYSAGLMMFEVPAAD
jgi:hypothetical protein